MSILVDTFSFKVIDPFTGGEFAENLWLLILQFRRDKREHRLAYDLV